YEQSDHSTRHHQHHSGVAGGFGHINEDLIFIERSGQQQRQKPPKGYEYKGKIEIQGVNKEYRSQSHGRQTPVMLPQPISIPQPVPQPVPQPIPRPMNPCPPGWQMIITGGPPGAPIAPVPVATGGFGPSVGLGGGIMTGGAGLGGI
ncbi:unnamed protein product, partial [Didymodactylos carnosus]